MRVFIDTNVVLDLLAQRKPFYEDAAVLFSLIHQGVLEGCVAAISFSTTAYVMRKLDVDVVKNMLSQFATLVTVLPIGSNNVREAVSANSAFNDIEDAMQYSVAKNGGCDVIVTRNVKDFVHSDIPVFSTDDFLSWYLDK